MTRSWVRVGAFSGLAASVAYPVAVFLPLPLTAIVILASVFGVGISLAAIGLYFLLALHQKTVTLQIGTLCNAMAGVMLLCMLIIQLSVNSMILPLFDQPPPGTSEQIVQLVWDVVGHVQLGLDVVWDIYLCLGTLLIAWNMRKHPRFGNAFFWTGTLIALPLTVFNLWTFPTPPGETSLVDLGPFLGLWYLIVSIQAIRSLRWADGVIG